MKRSSVLKVLVLAMFLSVLVIPFQGHAQEKVITLKVAKLVPGGSQADATSGELGKGFGKRTNGR